jgi:hypothetical protein
MLMPYGNNIQQNFAKYDISTHPHPKNVKYELKNLDLI